MKTMNYILCVLCGISTLFTFSCSDKNNPSIDTLGAKNITSITDRTTPITQANLTDFVMIHGSGFVDVKQILVNDVNVDLNTVYITPDSISLLIPRVLPKEVNNMVTIITDAGQIQVPLNVFIPDVSVKGMYDEFSLPGSTMTVVGDFFDLYNIDSTHGKVVFGTQELPIISSTANTVQFQVPNNAVAGTKIQLKSDLITAPVPGLYREEGFMLYDATNNLGWAGSDGKGTIITASTPNPPRPACNGDYIRITVTAAQTGWVGEAIAFGYIAYPQDMLDHPENYELKFEINTLKPVGDRTLDMSFGGCEWYDWDAYRIGGMIDTYSSWMTITENLKTVFGSNLPNNGATNSMIQIFPLTWIAQDVDLCFDNLRIVPISK